MLLLVSSGRGAQLHTRSASRALASRGANVVRSARQRMSERVGMMADDGASPGPRGVFRGVSDRSKPKRKVCVHVGFLGSNYHGMLYQESGIPTIERELFGALNLWGGISDDNADAPSKVGWQRASRTDKGVHAIGATVSLKLLLADEQLESQPSVDDPTAMLHRARSAHACAPHALALACADIRVWSIQRTRSGFDAYDHCSARRCALRPRPRSNSIGGSAPCATAVRG
jgi:tRNA pseudouridine38-40 synthase